MRALAAGRRDRRIIFQRATATRNFGGATTAWSELGRAWAQVSFGTGLERREAAQEASSAPATFRVLANDVSKDVGTKDRIVFDGSDWDIVSNVPLGREGREITAKRRTG